jgi:hypothetical protein
MRDRGERGEWRSNEGAVVLQKDVPKSEGSALQQEILELREQAERVASELLHRVRHVFAVRERLRENRGPLIAVGAGVAVLVTGIALIKLRHARGQRTLRARFSRKLGALREILREPEKITRRHHPDYGRIMTALILAGIGLGTRLVFRRISV